MDTKIREILVSCFKKNSTYSQIAKDSLPNKEHKQTQTNYRLLGHKKSKNCNIIQLCDFSIQCHIRKEANSTYFNIIGNRTLTSHKTPSSYGIHKNQESGFG